MTAADHCCVGAIVLFTHRHVAADEQIEPAIAVVIEERRSRMKSTRFCTSYAGLVGHIAKGSVAVVVIQNIPAVLSHKKIRKAIVVVIAPDTTQSVARPWNAGFLSDIGECAVSIIPVQGIAGGNAAIV